MWEGSAFCLARPTSRNASRYISSVLRISKLTYGLLLLLVIAVVPKLQGQTADEFDSYHVKLQGVWVYSTPTGTLQGSADSGTVNLVKDLNFNTYSTFFGKLDWKFTHKNHIYVFGSRFQSSKETVLTRTITFEDKTFQAGLTIRSSLESPAYGLGYQYDIIRRKRGHLGLGVQFNVFDTTASISAAAQVTADGVYHAAVSASGSLLAPIPVAGPEFRYYLLDSPRLFIQGQVYGMYFFGYGNYVSAWGTLGARIFKHLDVIAGYQLGNRLVVNRDTSTNRIGLNLTEKGPTAGLEFSF
jgi:hypothetical protein